MAELYFGDRLLVLPGVRYESTKVDYTGHQVFYDAGGTYVSTQPVTGGDTHGFLLPGFHVKYAFTSSSNLRVAYTRTLARPNYYDLVPYQVGLQEDGEIRRGKFKRGRFAQLGAAAAKGGHLHGYADGGSLRKEPRQLLRAALLLIGGRDFS